MLSCDLPLMLSRSVQNAGQEEDEDDEGQGDKFISFSQTQNDARSKMVQSAREPSKEVQIEVTIACHCCAALVGVAASGSVWQGVIRWSVIQVLLRILS